MNRCGFATQHLAGPDLSPAVRTSARADMFERRSDLVRLLAVADAERIATAAHRLAVTQPALSRIVARLEREFGGSLFERIPAGLRPTRFGALVLGHARRILRDIEDGEEAVAAALAGRTGRFRVTAPPLWMQAVVAPAVQAFHAVFPEVELGLRTAAWREGVRLLGDGRSDLHCGGPDTGEALPARLRRERFLDVTGGVVAASGHPLHAAGPEPRDLAGAPGPGRGRPVARLAAARPARPAARNAAEGPAPRLRPTPLPRRLRRPPLGRGSGPFRMLEHSVRDAALGRSGGLPG